jgi:hypothetical protein
MAALCPAPNAVIVRTVSKRCIIERLGFGGMGVVYKPEDTHLDLSLGGCDAK